MSNKDFQNGFAVGYASGGIVEQEYILPVGGDELGGVKNGGNVVINEDGTITAPTSDKEWKLITDITIPEEDAIVTLFVDKDDNGKPFSYTEINIVWEGIKVTDGTKSGKAWISLNPTRAGYNVGKFGHYTENYFYYIDNAYPNYTRGEMIKLDRGQVNNSPGGYAYYTDSLKNFPNGITSIEVSGYQQKSFYGRVVIYGR